MSKRPLDFYQEPWSRDWSHPALTATRTEKLATVPAGKKLRIDRVWYNNRTGLAGDGTNAFMLEIKVGSTVIATVFNTDTGDAGGAALAADTPILVSASTTLNAADVLTAVFTLEGTQTLPIGELRIEGRYV
jgi:hypothetical protein